MRSTFDTRLIDGKTIAAQLCVDVALRVSRLVREYALVPGLAVVLVGEEAASQTYVRAKGKAMRDVGISSFEHQLPASISKDALLELIAVLNADDQVHGILVQLPLPPQIDTTQVIGAISPDKDVDGFTVANAGRLFTGQDALLPARPRAA